MKIFYFITKSEQGGAQTHVAQLARFFIMQGNQVAIMSTPHGWLEKEAKKMIAQYFTNPYLGNTAKPTRLWRASRELIRAVNNFQPDIIACHSTIAGLLGRLTIRNRIPTVFTAHGWGFTQGAPFFRRHILPFLEKIASDFCDRVICVSKNDLQLAQNYRIASDSKLVQIYNGVEFPNTIQKNKSDLIRMVFVGRLAPPKDPLALIHAVTQLTPNERKQIKVLIIGDGPQKLALHKHIIQHHLENNIELAGALPRDQVLNKLASETDLFILISNWEGFPYSVLEAMAYRIPVIASDVGGIREAIGNGAGILIAPNDKQGLIQALKQLLNDPALRQTLGEQGFKRVQNAFSLNSMCEKTKKVYIDLLQQKTLH